MGGEEAIKAFLMNLAAALRLHVFGLSGRPRDSMEELAYQVGSHVLSFPAIREYLLAAPGSKPPSGLPAQPSDPRVALALFTGREYSPHFRVYHTTTLERQLEWYKPPPRPATSTHSELQGSALVLHG